MKRRVVIAVSAVLTLVAISSCSSDSNSQESKSSSASTTTVPEGDAFYTPPSTLPDGDSGDVIWSTEVSSADGATLHKVLYLSTNVKDEPIAVSGLVWVPDNVAADAAVVSYAHGTVGLGDQCTPSKDAASDEASLFAKELTKLGYIVAATDYEGLGTPGVHPYVVGLSEGRGVLDIIRTARNLTNTSGKSLIWGHSQGGGAALMAAEMAPTYAPDMNVVGSVAGAPAVELKLLAAVLRTSPFFGYIFMAGAGFKAAYPDIDLSQALTPEGISMVETAAKGCGEINDLVRGKDPALYISRDPATTEPFATYLEENTPGNKATTVPIFVYHGELDEQIPVIGSKLYLERACKTGGFTILRKTYPGATHVSVIETATPDILAWMDARLAGTPPETTPCE